LVLRQEDKDFEEGVVSSESIGRGRVGNVLKKYAVKALLCQTHFLLYTNDELVHFKDVSK